MEEIKDKIKEARITKDSIPAFAVGNYIFTEEGLFDLLRMVAEKGWEAFGEIDNDGEMKYIDFDDYWQNLQNQIR